MRSLCWKLKYFWNPHDKVVLHSAGNINLERFSGQCSEWKDIKVVQETTNASLKVRVKRSFNNSFA